MKNQDSTVNKIIVELIHHLPYSIFGVTMSLVLMGILTFIAIISSAEAVLPRASQELFHVFHPAHVLLSAVATTAMFWKHDNRNVLKALLIGFIGSITICGISDIIVPFFGGIILGADMHMHICIIEEPMLVYPFAIVGVLSGMAVTKAFEQSTQYSHGVHVFLSSTASLIYLIGFGLIHWMDMVGGVFIVTVFAVMFPCCLSDIVFPLACSHKFCAHPKEDQ